MTLWQKFSIPLRVFIVCCAFQISPDYHVNDIKIKTGVLFLDATFFSHLRTVHPSLGQFLGHWAECLEKDINPLIPQLSVK